MKNFSFLVNIDNQPTEVYNFSRHSYTECSGTLADGTQVSFQFSQIVHETAQEMADRNNRVTSNPPARVFKVVRDETITGTTYNMGVYKTHKKVKWHVVDEAEPSRHIRTYRTKREATGLVEKWNKAA